ncbi:hypothetical protein D8674_020628 [Pyrus ussuriensis x Pyrus communis]|uniref:EF-hand domain-containing protein n=1 Tax=Pyrus ussuriensis x Pyrus communis TaxID=2448454 RepID=A0A5N5HNA3_9ROSA|nr:hypothetical protein D8674_020628 [Pyrus ussuriensis x Pyrus communis]
MWDSMSFICIVIGLLVDDKLLYFGNGASTRILQWVPKGKQWRRKQIKRISEKLFEQFRNDRRTDNLKINDLYIGVLLVYNDINKHLSGKHFDPPSKDHVREMMKESDLNLDGEIDREEFAKFIEYLTADNLVVLDQLILTLIAAPAVAMATKTVTEGVPGIGKVVQRLPDSVYASLVTLTVVLFQQAYQEFG